MIQAGLVAGDTGVDLILATLQGLDHQVGIGKHRSGHRDQIGIAAGKHRFGHIRHVDTVAGDHRHRELFAQPSGDLGKGGSGHHGGDRGHRRLVPAEMRADDIRAGSFDCFAQRHHFVPGQPAIEHVHCGDPEDQDEVWPDRLTNPLHHLDRKPHPVFPGAAPTIGSQIGPLDKKGAQKIARRANNLHPVVACLAGKRCAVGEIGDLLLDAGLIELGGPVGTDA